MAEAEIRTKLQEEAVKSILDLPERPFEYELAAACSLYVTEFREAFLGAMAGDTYSLDTMWAEVDAD